IIICIETFTTNVFTPLKRDPFSKIGLKVILRKARSRCWMSSSIPFHQRLLELERKFRRMRQDAVDKKKCSVNGAATKSLCMTSPLPRRPMPLALDRKKQPTPVNFKLSNENNDGIVTRPRRSHDWNDTGMGLMVPVTGPSPNRHSDSAENERRLAEITRQTGVLRFCSSGEMYKMQPTDLELLGELGHGTCGHVVKMRFRRTGHLMAVKQMCRSGNKEENKRILMDLDVVLRSHDCPYIVQCYGCFITDSEVWICMELMATCLEKLIKQLGSGIPEQMLGKMAVSIVKALHYLKEKQGIIHRDVKPSNMLLDWTGTIKLCDFGISGRLVDSKAKTRTAGCVAYMAPERIDPPDPLNANYDIRADVWSLGVSLVELATGSFPYRNCSADFELLTRIIQDEPPLLKPADGFSVPFCDFIAACLTKNYKFRPKYAQLLEHPFIKQYETARVDVGRWLQNSLAQS
ncbi:Dual specificity mitogen-activated protein kinase kinase 7, partial [Trichinella patagoniensis]